MVRKLFIVQQGNARLFQTLTKALANELDVVVIYDRRDGHASAVRREEERRVPSVDDRIRMDGFAVVRPRSEPRSDGNIRWSA
jgi:hypothetical protein